MARSFFDNVIGLEAIVARRTTELAVQTRDMRLVLDNVEQGLLTVAMDGGMSGRSACVEHWFGRRASQRHSVGLLRSHGREGRNWIRLGWEAIVDDMLPIERISRSIAEAHPRWGPHSISPTSLSRTAARW